MPGYNALILRRYRTLLDKGGALIPRSHIWLDETDAKWSEAKSTWTFPSGSTLTFGHLDTKNDAMSYKGTDWQYIAFDELTEIPWEESYDYLHSRLRRLKDSGIPLRMRSATNPGGPGHRWVREKFIINKRKDHYFVPAFIDDNPYLDKDNYRSTLNKLHPLIRDQLLHGRWDIEVEGQMIKRQWWKVIPSSAIPRTLRRVRYWDLAASQGRGDYTVGLLLGENNSLYYIIDIIRMQLSPLGVEELIKRTAMRDGIGTRIIIEEEGGASGKGLSAHYQKDVLAGYPFTADHPTGSKVIRALPVATAIERQTVMMVEGHWNSELIDEASMFPQGERGHDDQVDALSGAYNYLTKAGGSHQFSSSQAIGGNQYDDSRYDSLPVF